MPFRSLLLVLAFAAGLFAIDRGLGLVLSEAASRLVTGEQVGRINHALAQKDAQIVVFGSSRAAHHIDPAILREDLGLSAFNAGAPGQSIRYARALEALLLERGTRARLFVLHVLPRHLWGVSAAPLQRFAPFYGESPALDAMLDATRPQAWLELQSEAYRYNSLVLPILGNLVRDRRPPGNGFRAIPSDRPQNLVPRSPADPAPGPVDPEIGRLYVDFIEAARRRGIEVVLVDGPRWRPDGFRPVDRIGQAYLERLARDQHAAWIVIDERNAPVFEDARYFSDIAHLTREGAGIFTRELARRLRPLVEALPVEALPRAEDLPPPR